MLKKIKNRVKHEKMTNYAQKPTNYAILNKNDLKNANISSRNQKNLVTGKEVGGMIKTIGKTVAKTAEISAKLACGSTSWFGLYQPATPKQLKIKKESKKN